MKAIRIVAYQNMVNYRKPTAYMVKESYPLPPYSSVIGMVHAACGFTNYQPMRISIQGGHYTAISEVAIKYEFGKGTKYDEGRHNVQVQNEEKSYGMTRGLGSIELLVDVELIIHIVPQEEGIIEQMTHDLRYPKQYLALGRWEDLLRIDSVDIVEVQEVILDDELILPFDAYVPLEREKGLEGNHNLRGSVYRLNKTYTIDPKLNIRRWDQKIHARYAIKGSQIDDGEQILLDQMVVNGQICTVPIFLA